MNEREMLEFAAKAMGWSNAIVDEDLALWDGDNMVSTTWTPLNDDGDALRLAVKLGMGVLVCVHIKRSAANVDDGEYLEVEHADDPYAATRRAIVRAAAEIGKAMP